MERLRQPKHTAAAPARHAPVGHASSYRPSLLSREADVLALQRTIGNRAVQRIIQRVSVDDYRAKMKKGNFSLGSATREEANKIGADWVGFKPTSKISVSEDGLHQYRKASWKPNWKEFQANVEGREQAQGRWTSNGHISIPEEAKE